MSSYLTEKSEHTGQISIFARANTRYDPEDENSLPWFYEFATGTTHWNSKAVLIVTHDLTLPIPAGINLVQKAVETLHAKIAEKKAELAKDVAELEAEISKLSLLTYQPEATIVPGYDGEADIEVSHGH